MVDELRMQRLEPRLMDFAGAEQRAGREDCLLSCLLKLEVAHIRILGVGLPMAGVKGDIWQGYPSSLGTQLLLPAHEAGVPDKDLPQLA